MPRGPQHTDEELLEEIRRLADELQRVPPLKRDMNKFGNHAARTYQLRFGSWSDAIEEAGFDPREQGEDYEERPDGCPLYGTEQTGLDFHHWRYGENEVGCYLCRECHDAIHQGKAKTANSGWLPYCVDNLVARHLEYHPDSSDVDVIVERYNLPNVSDLIARAIESNTSN